MKHLLLADAGSTKTDWSLISATGEVIRRLNTPGINPIQQDSLTISAILEPLAKDLKNHVVSNVIFFGAGCISHSEKQLIQNLISHHLCLSTPSEAKGLEIIVESDIMGASKALFGDETGLVCILGTGSNTCLVQNDKIKKQIPSLGYILGDEGSGSALGKKLINAIYKNHLPDSIIQQFRQLYELSIPEIIENVYQKPMPAAFLASFVPFLSENISLPAIKKLVVEELENFFLKNVIPYHLAQNIKLGFIGSVAFEFKNIILKIAENHGFKIEAFLKSPMPSLEKYYIQKLFPSSTDLE